MRNGLNELFSLAEENIKWLRDAARHIEKLTSQLEEPQKSEWALVAACYRERAEVHQTLVRKLRNGKPLTTTGVESLNAQN